MFSIEALQKLSKNNWIRQYFGILVSLCHACDIGKDVDNNLGVQQKIWLWLEVLINGISQVACSIVATRSSSLDVIIQKLFQQGKD